MAASQACIHACTAGHDAAAEMTGAGYGLLDGSHHKHLVYVYTPAPLGVAKPSGGAEMQMAGAHKRHISYNENC